MNKKQVNLNRVCFYMLLVVYLGLLIYQHQFIHMYGDDYYYATFLREDFVAKHIYHYKFINGRALVHVLVSLMLYFKTHLFSIINPLIIIGTLLLLTQMLVPQVKNKISVFALNICLFSMLSIHITRQSVYWLDGSFNYVFPMLMAIATLYYFRKSIVKRKNIWYVPLLGLVAGMTVEQASAITFGGLLLLLLSERFIHHRKICWSHYLTLILALLGSLSILLASGTSSRIEVEEGINIIANLQKVVGVFFLYKDMQVYHLLLLGGNMLWLKSMPQKRYRKVLFYINAIILIGYLLMGNSYEALMPINIESKRVLLLVVVCILFYIGTLLDIGLYLLLKKKESLFLIALILAGGSQLMMVASPIYDYRNLLCGILLCMLPIGLTYITFQDKPITWFGIAFSFAYTIGWTVISLMVIIFGGCYVISRRFLKNDIFRKGSQWITVVLVGIVTLTMIRQNILGYKTNHEIYIQNEKKIYDYLDGQVKENPLILKEMPLYDYGWSYPYINPYHMKVMKIYYGLDESVAIEYIP